MKNRFSTRRTQTKSFQQASFQVFLFIMTILAAKSICFEQLQQLCASEHFTNTLPDLGRQDLEE
jgi:hypothetical protein